MPPSPDAAPMLLEDRQAIRPGLAAMQDHRQARGPRQLQLFDEHALLNVARRMVVVIVETDLAPGQETADAAPGATSSRSAAGVASFASCG